MNEHEEKFILSFITKTKQARYQFLLSSSDPKRRLECRRRLSHRDLNPKYAEWLPKNPLGTTKRSLEIAASLREMGSPSQVYVLSDESSIDGQTMKIEEACTQTEIAGWGTVISCIPGELAYFFAEDGERRAILRRPRGT